MAVRSKLHIIYEFHLDENILRPVVEFAENGHRVLCTPSLMYIAKYLLLLRTVNKSCVKVPMYDGSAGQDDAQQQNLIGVLQFVSGYTYFRLSVRYRFCLTCSFLVMSSCEIISYGQKSLVFNPAKISAYECRQRHS